MSLKHQINKLAEKLGQAPRRVIYLFLALVIGLGSLLVVHPRRAHAQTDTFTTSGTWTVPAGVSSAVFEAWGGGAPGSGTSARNTAGGGGGGGDYAKKTLTGLIAADTYTVNVGTLTSGTTGIGCFGSTSYISDPSSTLILRALGGTGYDYIQATCGSLAGRSDIGDTTYAGGDGFQGLDPVDCGTAGSGAGGGAAGPSGSGGFAFCFTGGTGTGTNSGSGGTGVSSSSNGNAGSNYGGGGSGAYQTAGGTNVGGDGAQGFVTITYTIVSNSAPNAPTLSSPANGSTINSTAPNLVMSATDTNSDSVKYKTIIYNTTATSGGNCSGTAFITADQTASGVGWDNGTTAYASGANATYTFQSALTRGSGYCWQAQAIDPAGSNTFSSLSAASIFTVNSTPAAPTLIAPSGGATGQATSPTLQLRTTDPDGDYLRYKIIIYNSDCSTNPQTFDETSSQTGWSGQDQQTGTAYTGSSTITGSTIANFSGTALSGGATYCWKAAAIDPGGTNTWSSYSSTQTFTTANGSAPSAPTLITPAAAATNQSQNPIFRMRSSDPDGDYLRYKIIIYNSDCSTNPQTFDQTVSQPGWTNRDQQNFTAYTGSATLSSSTMAWFGLSNLSANTTYCWKAAAIDPGGANSWGSLSATQLFTTGASNSGVVNISGGANVRGGAYVR